MGDAAAQRIPINDLKRHNAPVAEQLAERLRAVLDSGWYILGPQVEQFEAAFARYCGVEHCIGMGNGTDALELALRACGVGLGDRVATVANAGGYSTAAIRAVGAEPLYVDIEPRSMLMDPARLEASLAAGPRAIIATHLYGRMVDMGAVLEAASHGGIRVIEDCAQAHGARLGDRRAGSWGALGCFSFYPTKNLGALGDGGAVITSDAALADRVRELRQYGWSSKYRARLAGGRNSRLDEMQAAVLVAKLPHLEGWNERRRAIACFYSESLRGLDVQAPETAGPEYVAHLYVVRVRDRDWLRPRLHELGVMTDVHYPVPDHQQECWRGEHWSGCRLPVTEQCCREVVTLPCFPELTDAEIERVAAVLAFCLAAA